LIYAQIHRHTTSAVGSPEDIYLKMTR